MTPDVRVTPRDHAPGEGERWVGGGIWTGWPTPEPERRVTHGRHCHDPELEDRFWPKVDRLGPMVSPYLGACWLWLARRDGKGYGRFAVKVVQGWRTDLAHRVAYELTHGAIPRGLEIDHLCRNRACVNPAHLEAVTHRENLRRGTRGGCIVSSRVPEAERGSQ